jgi:hypothetical protein
MYSAYQSGQFGSALSASRALRASDARSHCREGFRPKGLKAFLNSAGSLPPASMREPASIRQAAIQDGFWPQVGLQRKMCLIFSAWRNSESLFFGTFGSTWALLRDCRDCRAQSGHPWLASSDRIPCFCGELHLPTLPSSKLELCRRNTASREHRPIGASSSSPVISRRTAPCYGSDIDTHT